jgi:hypothetical protein
MKSAEGDQTHMQTTPSKLKAPHRNDGVSHIATSTFDVKNTEKVLWRALAQNLTKKN